MDIVDKKYVDDRDITSITTPNSIDVKDLTYINNKKIIFNRTVNPITIPLNTFGNYSIDKNIQLPDNAGNSKLLLIADITSWYNNTSDTANNSTLKGFSGIIHGIRNSGYMVTDYAIVTAMTAWLNNGKANTITLESSNDRYKPCIVKYDNKYYIAISILGSGYNVFLRGYHNAAVDFDKFIILTSNANTHLAPIEGVEYVMTNKIKNYYPINAQTAQIAELANSVKEASIDIMKLDMQARRPYIHNGIDSLNNIDYDAIFNLVWNTYGTNGNQAMPTIGIAYTTDNNATTEYNRQLMYNPNLGTFQYRNKVTTSNTWDDWTPIPIPQTTILHKSYLRSEHIDTLTTSGFYVLTNNSAINYSTMSEFIVVHNNSQGQVFQTHYGANNNIKGRIGNLQSDGTVTWNNWIIKAYTYNISYDGNMYRYNDFTNSWLAMTTTDFTNIVNNLQLPNIKCKCRIKHDTNNYSTCDVKLYKQNSFIMSYFDFDTNQTVYIKVWLEGDVIKTNKKTITFES